MPVALLLLACASAEPPSPAPAPEPTTPGAPVSRPVFVDLAYGKPVDVPALDAEVTLVEAKTSLFVDPETGKRGEAASGTLRIVDRAGQETELAFGPGKPMSYAGRRLAMRGADLSWQLIIR